MTKDELRKQVRSRLKLDPVMRKLPEAEIDAAMEVFLGKLSDTFTFDGNSVLWLERQVRLSLHKPTEKRPKQ